MNQYDNVPLQPGELNRLRLYFIIAIGILLAIAFGACQKQEATTEPCEPKDTWVLTLTNAMPVRMDVVILYPSQYVQFYINEGQTQTRTVPEGRYVITATGKGSGPFAHEVYEFSKVLNLAGCDIDPAVIIE